MPSKAILIILDGLADRPCREFFGETPLEAASTPFMDYLARNGICGMQSPLGTGFTPESGPAHFEILGYHPFRQYYPGRGPIEALGAGARIKEGDVAFRVNFATMKNGRIVDRRAGRIADVSMFEHDLSMEIDGVEFILKAGTEHRAALIIRGDDVSENLSDSDPKKEGKRPLKIKPLSKDAEQTAKLVNKYLELATEILEKHELNRERRKKGLLPANTILLRGAGRYRQVESFRERYGLKACCIAGAGLYKGIARHLGMNVINVEGATGTKSTDVEAKIKAAKAMLKRYDFIFVHVKGTDLYGHDGDAGGKKAFIEKVDRALQALHGTKSLIVLTGDHATPCSLKDHSGDDVPILFYAEDMIKDNTYRFGEHECMNGGLKRIEGKDIMPEILNLLGKEEAIE